MSNYASLTTSYIFYFKSLVSCLSQYSQSGTEARKHKTSRIVTCIFLVRLFGVIR